MLFILFLISEKIFKNKVNTLIQSNNTEYKNIATSKQINVLLDNTTSSIVTGNCTGTINYTLYLDNKTLIISGSGKMNDFSVGKTPWYSHRQSIKTAIVENGITYLSKYSFYLCQNLESVSLPESLTSIGPSAFHNCNSMNSIIIPNSVETIGLQCFYYCYNLSSFTIPSGVTSIGNSAFAGCSNLEKFIVDNSNTMYKSIDDILFTLDEETIVCYPAGKKNTSYVVPDSVSSISSGAFSRSTSLNSIVLHENIISIGSNAFESTNLSSITIPNKVTIISEKMFSSCINLLSIKLHDNITLIKSYAFEHCQKLTTIKIPESVKTIEDHAFYYCTQLVSLVIPNNVTNLGYYVCGGDVRLSSLSIGTNVKDIGMYSFKDTSLKSVFIPNSVTRINDDAFANCHELESIIISESVKTMGNYVFFNDTKLSLVYFLGETNPTFGNSIFRNCNKLERVFTTQNNLENYFDEKKIFTKLQVGSCGENVNWTYNEYLKTLSIYGSGEMHEYGSNFPWNNYKTTIGSVSFEFGVTTIADYAFYRFNILEKVILSDSIEKIGNASFYLCPKLQRIKVSENSFNLISLNNVVYSKNMSTLILYPPGKNDTLYIIPENVSVIKHYAFGGCSNLTELFYTGKNEPIFENNVFSGCKKLKTIHVPLIYDKNTFDSYPANKNLIIGNCGENANWVINVNSSDLIIYGFGNTYNYSESNFPSWDSYKNHIKHAYILHGIDSIGDYTFCNCDFMETINISGSVNKIGVGSLNFCKNLRNINYDKYNLNYSTVDGVLFNKNESILICYPIGKLNNSYLIPKTVISIDKYAFYGSINLQSVSIYKDVKYIGDYSFYSSGINTLVISKNITTIGQFAFANCSSLTIVTISDGNYNIKNNAFSNCSELYLFSYLSNNSPKLGENIFDGCDKLKSVQILSYYYGSYFAGIPTEKDNLINGGCGSMVSWILSKRDYVLIILGYGSMDDHNSNKPPTYFKYSEYIKTVIIENDVDSIGDFAFYLCRNITSITIPGCVDRISSHLFGDCINLQYIIVRDSNKYYKSVDNILYSINGDSLYCYPPIRNGSVFIIPENVKGINSYAFSNNNLTTIVIPNNLTSIGRYAFYRCDYLTTIVFFGSKIQSDENSVILHCQNFENILAPLNFPKSYIGDYEVSKGFISGNCGDDVYWILSPIKNHLLIYGFGNMNNFSLSSQAPWYLNNSDIKTITIENGVTSIGNYAFYQCENLTRVNISGTVNTIESLAFSSCSNLQYIFVDHNNEIYKSINGVLYSIDESELLLYPPNKNNSLFIILENIIVIGSYAFNNCNWLSTIIYMGNNEPSFGIDVFNGSENIIVKVSSDYKSDTFGGISINKNNIIGTCGENLRWILFLDINILYIFGHGKMDNYNATYQSPWNSYKSFIGEVTIDEGVESIGDFSFTKCNNFTNINISETVESIGKGAFSFCPKLVSFTLSQNQPYFYTYKGILYTENHKTLICYPAGKNETQHSINSNVITIESYAFAGCTNLEIFVFSVYVKRVNEHAFDSCGITELFIPGSVTFIGESAFQNCSNLARIIYDGKIAPTVEKDIFLGCPNETFPILVLDSYKNNSFGNYSILKSLVFGSCGSKMKWMLNKYDHQLNIYGSGYMNNYSDPSMTSQPSLPTWHYYAIYIRKIIVEENILSIGNYAFIDLESLKTIYLPESLIKIGDRVFNTCTKLVSIEVNRNNPLFESSDGILYSKNLTQLISYPSNKHDKTFIVPEIVKRIEAFSFINTINLKTLIINNGTEYIGNNAFSKSCINEIFMPESVQTIRYSAFQECKELKSVIYTGNNISNAHSDTFNNLYKLKFVEVPFDFLSDTFGKKNVVKSISYGKIGNVNWISSINTSILNIYGKGELNTFASPNEYPWHSHKSYIKTINIKNEITSIGDFLFSNFSNLELMNISNSITSIGIGAFSLCPKLKSFYVDPDNAHYKSINDILYSKDGTILMNYPPAKTGISFSIPENVTVIGSYAFSYCNTISTIVFSNKTETIKNHAFYSSRIKLLNIPEKVISIESYAFAKCNFLESVVYYGLFDPIAGENVFNESFQLKSIQVLIDYQNQTFCQRDVNKCLAFGDCGANSHWMLNIDNGTLDISGYGDIDNYSLSSEHPWELYKSYIKTIIINNGITSIGNFSFINMANLSIINISNSIVWIGTGAFAFCDNIQIFNLTKNNKNYEVYDKNLYTKGKESLIRYASGNKKAAFSNLYGCTYIEDYAFSNSHYLETINLLSHTLKVGNYAFFNCNNLSTITIQLSSDYGSISIENYAFANCTSLYVLQIGNAVQSFGDYVFANCNNLTSIYYNGTIEPIQYGMSIFNGCNKIKHINVLISYENESFCGYPVLREVIIVPTSEYQTPDFISTDPTDIDDQITINPDISETKTISNAIQFNSESDIDDQTTINSGISETKTISNTIPINSESDVQDQTTINSGVTSTNSETITLNSYVATKTSSINSNSYEEPHENISFTPEPPKEVIITLPKDVDEAYLDQKLKEEYDKMNDDNTNKVIIIDSNRFMFNSNLTETQFVKPLNGNSEIQHNGGNLNLILPDSGKVTVSIKKDEASISINGEGELNILSKDLQSNSINITSKSQINGPVKITIPDEVETITIDSIELVDNSSILIHKENKLKPTHLNIYNVSTAKNADAFISNANILNSITVVQTSSINFDNVTLDQAIIYFEIMDFATKENSFIKGNLTNVPNKLILKKVSDKNEIKPESIKEYTLINGMFEKNLCENWLDTIQFGNTGFNTKKCITNTHYLSQEDKRIVVQLTNTKSKNKLNGGQIAGIVIGCIAGVAIIVVAVICIIKHKHKDDSDDTSICNDNNCEI